LVTQFRYARFTLEGYHRDVALTARVDRAPCITFGHFGALAKRRGWTVDSLASCVKGELDEPKRTLERLLKTGPAETVIPYPCLTERYLKATATPAEGTTTGQRVSAPTAADSRCSDDRSLPAMPAANGLLAGWRHRSVTRVSRLLSREFP
jgi:hypothetical protein